MAEPSLFSQRPGKLSLVASARAGSPGGPQEAGSTPWLPAPDSLGPPTPQSPFPQKCRMRMLPGPPSLCPSGLGSGSLWHGPVVWGLPDPGAQDNFVLPSAPCCPTFAAALLRACFCRGLS